MSFFSEPHQERPSPPWNTGEKITLYYSKNTGRHRTYSASVTSIGGTQFIRAGVYKGRYRRIVKIAYTNIAGLPSTKDMKWYEGDSHASDFHGFWIYDENDTV
jgi:hypothetical protein